MIANAATITIISRKSCLQQCGTMNKHLWSVVSEIQPELLLTKLPAKATAFQNWTLTQLRWNKRRTPVSPIQSTTQFLDEMEAYHIKRTLWSAEIGRNGRNEYFLSLRLSANSAVPTDVRDGTPT